MNQILGFDEFINDVNESGKWSVKIRKDSHRSITARLLA